MRHSLDIKTSSKSLTFLSQMDTMVFSAGQREQEVRDLKRDVADLLRHIQRLNADLESQLRKVCLAESRPAGASSVLHPSA